ncbi:winged helix-turn-helix domain-containing protein [Bacillus cereus]|nr:winged helix-turn-helix domain-containing protein [Bacillus cereus]
MKNTNHKIMFKESLILELLAAMFRIQNHERLLPTDSNNMKHVEEELKDWVVYTSKNIPTSIKKELEVFFNFESFFALNLSQLLWKYQQFDSIEEAISLLNSISEDDIVMCFFETGYGVPKKNFNLSDSKEILNLIELLNIPEVEKWKLFYLCSNPKNTKNRLINLIENFYTCYLPNLSEFQELHKKSNENLSQNEQIVNQLLLNIDMNKNTSPMEIVLIPSFYYNTSSLFSYSSDTNTLILVYGLRTVDIAFQQFKNQMKIPEMLKILSDETRIKIIKTLNIAPRYGYELAQELGLSNSTISHHISVLSSFGFISALRSENKIYYQTNKENIQSALDKFGELLVNENS